MRSVYTKIVAWCFATLILSMAAMVMVSVFVFDGMVGKGSFFDRINVLLLEESETAYESGGPKALAAHLKRADKTLGGEHHLVDTRGRDLATGGDQLALLRQFRFEKGAIQQMIDGRIAAGVASPDGRYRLLVLAANPYRLASYFPYYIPILAAVAILCWALAARIASPLRDLARAVDRFGRGDLSARVNSRRRDEIGELGREFDRMAERIGFLLTSERRLLQDISHELRTPLARLSFAAELVRTSSDRDAAVARLKKQIRRLADLVGQLLEATQAEGDPSSLVKENLMLDEIVSAVVEDCHLEADARGSRIRLRGTEPLPIEGYPELLRRALENVVRNAIRYAPEGSTVELSMIVADQSAGIAVRDYGPGVPEEMLAKIFQPFVRVDDSRSSQTGGVGLGLTIAQRAIALHHGRIAAENANPGLRVSFEIPIASRSARSDEQLTSTRVR
jgi:signal transduction histidine kinase